MSSESKTVDVAMIGGGIMSVTLAALLKQVDPELSIVVYERLGDIAMESSDPWNNAGTGHAALCELNYTPQTADGTIDSTKAFHVNAEFQISRQFWSYLVNQGVLPDPAAFISPVPHMSMVFGEANIAFLKSRYEILKDHPLFAGMQYTEDRAQISEWVPLTMQGQNENVPVAATYSPSGTDVNFGRLTHLLSEWLKAQGVLFLVDRQVTQLHRSEGWWQLGSKNSRGVKHQDFARTVFVGAGGGSLQLLQKSGIPEIRGFGGFPVSGQFLRTTDPEIVAQHQAKVYGKASVGAPPMSVPHLDTRVVDGQTTLMFGPYAGFTPKFLKFGSLFDLLRSVRFDNLVPMIAAGLSNLGLVKYLVSEVFQSHNKRVDALRVYYPEAKNGNWELITAGQRVQVIKPVKGKGGILQFGTEVIASPQNGIAGLLGASPGASTAAPIMIEVLEKIFADRLPQWQEKLSEMIPSYGHNLIDDEEFAAQVLADTTETLKLNT